jgi:hypothetical protein
LVELVDNDDSTVSIIDTVAPASYGGHIDDPLRLAALSPEITGNDWQMRGRRTPRVDGRLNRGGDRHANAAFYRIVLTRLCCDPRTHAYIDRRTAEGKTRRGTIRCLKRYVAREIYNLIQPPGTTPARSQA